MGKNEPQFIHLDSFEDVLRLERNHKKTRQELKKGSNSAVRVPSGSSRSPMRVNRSPYQRQY
jgi:hypothetical protein